MEEQQSEQMGSLEEATKNAAQLLDLNPALAAEQAEAILEAVPNHPPAMFLLASALRRGGKAQDAVDILEPLLNAQHKWAAAFFEYGVSLGMVKRGDEAIAALLRAVEYQPEHPEAWRYLADHLIATGDMEGGDLAYARHVRCSTRDPGLQAAAAAMIRNDVVSAERLLKRHLKRNPTDVAAIRMLAEVAVRCERDEEAEVLLERCLELAPSFAAARYNYALILNRRNDSGRALKEIELCLDFDSGNASYRNLCAVILSRVGEYERSAEIYAALLDEYPSNAKVWLSYGHVLKTAGRQEDCIDTYRKSIALDSELGEAYWSLANMKTFKFASDELATMHACLENPDIRPEDRWHLHFSLGKAYEDDENFAKSFDHYAKGNEFYRSRHGYKADSNTTRIDRLKAKFSTEFFEQRRGLGAEANDPIFIVGMPRAGSTLIEQILSCHSKIEGTTELPDMITMAQRLRRESDTDGFAIHVDVLAGKDAAELRQLGETYIEGTRIHRKTDRPLFIDKMPNNFLHVGLIHTILPNAKIIDARRHPLGCCFSNYKQFYARGQNFSYGLEDMAKFYRDYVVLMSHYDELLPGRIHRVFYEETVSDTERVVRDVLAYCGLDYEAECLRFFESKRPVRTASSEQVRQPIYRGGIEQWRNYDPWLDPARKVLGELVDAYPQVPAS